MIRVDGWSSPRVLDSMLGVSTFLQNQILMDSYYLEKNIRGIWNFLVFEVFFAHFRLWAPWVGWLRLLLQQLRLDEGEGEKFWRTMESLT